MGSLFSSSGKSTKSKTEEKVNVLDLQALTFKMNEEVKHGLEQLGFEEDHLLSNVKIVCGIIIVGLAVYSYWSQNRLEIAAICLVYLGANLALQYVQWKIQRYSFFLSKSNSEGVCVRVGSKLKESYSTKYVLMFGLVDGTEGYMKRLGTEHPLFEEEREFDLTNFFDASGRFDRDGLGTELQSLMDNCQKKGK